MKAYERIAEICPRCLGKKTIRVLGSGGDFEDWPCPMCEKKVEDALERTRLVEVLKEIDDIFGVYGEIGDRDRDE